MKSKYFYPATNIEDMTACSHSGHREEAFYTFAAQQDRLTIIKLLLDSQDVICFARYSV